MEREIVIVRLKAELSVGRMNKILDRALNILSDEYKDEGNVLIIDEISGSDAFEKRLNEGKLQNKKLIISCETGTDGINIDGYQLMKTLNFHAEKHEEVLKGTVCGIIVDGKSDLYTKDLRRRFALSLNRAGATLPGKPLVEATGKLRKL